jgi:DNA modification methylase
MLSPYYDQDGITIYHGDCRDIVPHIGRCDLVVTDPPYGVSYEGGHFHSGNVNIKRSREQIAGDEEDVYEWMVPLIFSACDGPCYSFFADGNRSHLIFQAVLKSRGHVHSVIIWHKTNAKYAAMNAQYKQRHEPMLYFKGPKAKTNWIGSSTESTIWEMRRAEKNIHPTQKPVEVMQRAISNHRADIVLDPFMGVGTTLLAAKLAGRRAVGVEMNERFCNIAADSCSQGSLFAELQSK